MLQHNAHSHSRHAHVTHAAVMGLHALCCGLPALAMLAAATAGATSGVAVLAQGFEGIHEFLHRHEIWILALSAALVVSGGILELLARRGRANAGFPWLFAFSALCFAVNLAIIAAHRG